MEQYGNSAERRLWVSFEGESLSGNQAIRWWGKLGKVTRKEKKRMEKGGAHDSGRSWGRRKI